MPYEDDAFFLGTLKRKLFISQKNSYWVFLSFCLLLISVLSKIYPEFQLEDVQFELKKNY